jgi:hypothetical protein
VKTVEEYAVELVVAGARHVAEDDLNEDGDVADEDHGPACDLALNMARAIEQNPRSFAEWCKAMNSTGGL